MSGPRTRYARTKDGVNIAYQVVGDGPIDLVLAHAWISHVEIYWEWPGFRRFVERLGRYARTILFDKRGVGLSDRLVSVPTFEARLDDVGAVLDTLGSERAVLFGYGDGAALAALFAATHPARTLALITFGAGSVKIAWSPDNPWGQTREEFEADQRRALDSWGDEQQAEVFAELVEGKGSRLAMDPAFGPWFARLLRYGSGPGDAAEVDRVWWETDATRILPAIHVPCAILNREGWSDHDKAWADRVSERVPGSRVLQVPGVEWPPWAGEVEATADVIGGFLTEIRDEEAALDRMLATVMFTDIVDSTAKATQLGDRGWRDLVEQHHSAVRALLARYRGIEVDTAGDGFFATFDGPARAVRCAQACIQAVRPLGIEIRAGVHTGKVETIAGKVGGVAVNIGARVSGLARPSEVMVSQTVKDLVAGSGLVFEEAGEHELKGVPDRWRLYRVAGD
jgi:class 3 adenylate cyclase